MFFGPYYGGGLFVCFGLLPLWFSPAANELHSEVTWKQRRKKLTDVGEQAKHLGESNMRALQKR